MARLSKIALAMALVFIQASSLFGDPSAAAAERGELPLKWRTKTITIAMSSSLLNPASNIKDGTDVVAAVRRSLKVWEYASGVEFREISSDKINVSPQGMAGDGISLITVAPTAENALLFAKNAEETAATTRVFYDARGRISEADIVLNPYQQFSADGTFGTFDIEATLTHEIGHVLGLEHSTVRGSTMYENFGKNGVFGLHGFAHRTLSEIDRTAARQKYGAPSGSGDCCGTVNAKLQLPEGKPAAGIEIWAEDVVTGKVVAQGQTAADGSADLNGLPNGSYLLYSGRKERSKKPIPFQLVGNFRIGGGEPAQISKKLEPGSDEVEVQYTGFNGQLTMNAVPVNSGKSFTIYIGGRNLSAKGLSINFNSPHFEVVPASITSHDYGSELSVISFEVRVDPAAPVGEYTIFAENPSGARSAAVGALSVRTFNNPYSNLLLDARSFR